MAIGLSEVAHPHKPSAHAGFDLVARVAARRLPGLFNPFEVYVAIKSARPRIPSNAFQAGFAASTPSKWLDAVRPP